jgi:hypothetical protein
MVRTKAKPFTLGILALGTLFVAVPETHGAFITDVGFNVSTFAVDRNVGVKNVGIPFNIVTQFSEQQLSRASADYFIPTADRGSMGARYDFINTASSSVFGLAAQFNLLTSGANLATIRTYTVDGSQTPLQFTTTQPTFYFASISQLPFGPADLVGPSNMFGLAQLGTHSSTDIFDMRVTNSSAARFGLLPANTRFAFAGDLDSTIPGVSTVSLALAPLNGASTPDAPLMPILVENGFNFVFNVAGQRVYVDPVVATGYDYIADAGQTFTSVILPAVGTQDFSLFLWNGTEWVFNFSLEAGNEHFFGGSGVDRFRIAGISISAGLDPNNPSAFVTGLTFHNNGISSMHMIPLLSPVPLPSTMILFGVGLVAMSYMVFMNKCKTPAPSPNTVL